MYTLFVLCLGVYDKTKASSINILERIKRENCAKHLRERLRIHRKDLFVIQHVCSVLFVLSQCDCSAVVCIKIYDSDYFAYFSDFLHRKE